MKRIGLLVLTVLLALSLVSCATAKEGDGEGDTGGEIDMSLLAETRIVFNEDSPRILEIRDNGNDSGSGSGGGSEDRSEYTVLSTDEERKTLHQSTITLTEEGEGEQSDLVEIAAAEADQFIYVATASPEGKVVYTCGYEDDTEDSYLIDSEGKIEEIDIPSNRISFLRYVDSGSLLFEDRSGLMRFNTESEEVEATYPLNNSQIFTDSIVIGDNLVVLSTEVVDEAALYSTKAFDLESGDEASDLSGLTQAIDSIFSADKVTGTMDTPALSRNAETEEVCVLFKGSVYAVNNNEVSLRASGESTNLVNTSLMLLNLLSNDKGFIALYHDKSEGSFKVYSYRFGRPKTEKTLTLYLLEDNPEIRQVASSFREENETVEVITRVGLPEDTALTAEDAIRQLNLDILAGEGPDIILLDDLSVDQFQKENLLADMSDVLNRLKEGDTEYYEKVLSCYEGESGCYAIPTRFALPSILANKELLGRIGSMEDLTEVAESYRGEKQGFLGVSCDLAVLFTADYGNIVQDDSVSKEELSRFFEQSKRMVDISAETLAQNKEVFPSTRDAVDFALEGFTNKHASPMVGSALLGSEDRLALIGIAGSASDFPDASLAINNSEHDLAFKPLKFTDRQVFLPNTILGVSSASPNTDLAKQFIEFALSDEQQKSDQRVGLPVNKTIFKEVLEEVSSARHEVSFGGEFSYSSDPLGEEEIQDYLELVDSVETACTTDRIITDLVKAGLESYLRGQVSLDEAVESTYQKISLYFLE